MTSILEVESSKTKSLFQSEEGSSSPRVSGIQRCTDLNLSFGVLHGWCLGCFCFGLQTAPKLEVVLILLMEEIPNNHLGCTKPCKSWDIYHINWCRISSIHSIIAYYCCSYLNFRLPWIFHSHDMEGSWEFTRFVELQSFFFWASEKKQSVRSPSERTNLYLGGGFKYFLFSPLPGEMIQFD